MKQNLTQIALLVSLLVMPAASAEDFIPQSQSEKLTLDLGPTPALEAVTALTEQPYQQQEIIAEEYISAEQQLYTEMERRGWSEGWDAKKRRLFVVHAEMFDSEDPSYDDSFVSKRSQYAMLATINAKAKMVEFMRTEMSAVDQISAPGTDVHAELNPKYLKLQKKLAAQQVALEKLLAQVNAAEAEKLKGVTFTDRSNAYMDAMIKQIDADYDAGKLAADKVAKYEKVKLRYQSAKAEIADIEAQAKAIKDTITFESSSTISTLAKAPILGASVLVQAESWNADEEKYEVATLMVWSKKLEQAAKAINTGEPVLLKPKKALTVQQWLRSQDAATLAGPRQYVDKNGARWFMGAYSMPAEGSSSLIRKNRNITEMMAKKEAVMALYADIETQKQAKVAMQTRKGGLQEKDNTKVATSFAETTRQSIQDRQVNGLSKLFGKTLRHPISQQKIYVAAYGISANSAADALAIESSAYDAAAASQRANTENKANKQALDKKRANTAASTSRVTPANTNKVRIQKATQSRTIISAPAVDDDDF